MDLAFTLLLAKTTDMQYTQYIIERKVVSSTTRLP